MGKAAMCIRMLQILNTGRIYKISELADLLNTNPRNILEYKKELEEVACETNHSFFIETVPGRYGGYRLSKNYVIPSLKLLPEEKESIIEGFNMLMNKSNFLKKDIYSIAIGKIASSIELPEDDRDLLSADGYKLTMPESDIKKRYDLIEEAIASERVIEIEYESIKNGLKKHILHPYKLFIYNNAWFFLAFNPEVDEVWYFKLNRIVNIKLLNKKFRVWKGFNPKDYFDGNGFKNNGDYIHLVLKAKGLRKQLFKERCYGKNQKITENDGGSITIEMDMQNENQIISLVLGGGSEVEVLEPVSIIDGVKAELSKIKDIYEK